jgi:hypothetical protein
MAHRATGWDPSPGSERLDPLAFLTGYGAHCGRSHCWTPRPRSALLRDDFGDEDCFRWKCSHSPTVGQGQYSCTLWGRLLSNLKSSRGRPRHERALESLAPPDAFPATRDHRGGVATRVPGPTQIVSAQPAALVTLGPDAGGCRGSSNRSRPDRLFRPCSERWKAPRTVALPESLLLCSSTGGTGFARLVRRRRSSEWLANQLGVSAIGREGRSCGRNHQHRNQPSPRCHASSIPGKRRSTILPASPGSST